MSTTAGVIRRAVTDRDALSLAMSRAAGSPAIGRNVVRHYPDSPLALDAMLQLIGRARHRIHLENYIIRDDATGQRFADALVARAHDGCTVRVLYDWVGCRGTGGRFWRRLRHAGVETRAFRPLFTTRPFDFFSRDHRKLLVVDGESAILGGLCIGTEWSGDSARGRQPWRDTMVGVDGPAALALEGTFARTWAVAGPPLPADELESESDPRGGTDVRVVEGAPGLARVYRTAQLACAAAVERIWVTDAYLVVPAPLWTGLLDAARDGVDVRLLLPSTSDVPLVRDLTRVGYRELLDAGIRVYEWTGPMLHAKCMLTDHRWARVGSSNLNASSLYANFELDVLIESEAFVEELAAQFRRDLARSAEVVLRPRRFVRPRLTAPAPIRDAGDVTPPGGAHRRSLYERQMTAAVTLRRVAGGLRRALTATAAAAFALMGVVFLVFPTVSGLVFAALMFFIAAGLGLDAVRRRRRRGSPRR